MNIKSKILIVAFFCTAVTYAQNDTVVEMFRKVQFHKKEIGLTAQVDKYADIAIKISPRFYYLKKGSFSIADSIALEVNAANQIIAFRFFYDYAPEYSNDTAYIHELHKYQKIMNSAGREYHYTSVNISIKVTKWEAKNTMFELVEITKNGKKKVHSVIFDKAPYFKTLRCGEIKNKDNATEMLNLIGVN